MQEYELHILKEDSAASRIFLSTYPSDMGAVTAARALVLDSDSFEVWCGPKCIFKRFALIAARPASSS